MDRKIRETRQWFTRKIRMIPWLQWEKFTHENIDTPTHNNIHSSRWSVSSPFSSILFYPGRNLIHSLSLSLFSTSIVFNFSSYSVHSSRIKVVLTKMMRTKCVCTSKWRPTRWERDEDDDDDDWKNKNNGVLSLKFDAKYEWLNNLDHWMDRWVDESMSFGKKQSTHLCTHRKEQRSKETKKQTHEQT